MIRNEFGEIAWNLNCQVLGDPVMFREEEKRGPKRTRKADDGESRKRCSCNARDQCHQPLAMPRCQGLRSKLLQMGVKYTVCCLRKKITKSDVDRGQHRFLLPNELLSKRVLTGLMTDDEERQTVERSGLAVRTLDRMGREHNLTLRFLDTIQAYRIMGRHYTRLVQDNGFRPGQMADLLVFRIPPESEFAMAVIEYEKDEEKESAPAQDPVSLCCHGGTVNAAWTLTCMRSSEALSD